MVLYETVVYLEDLVNQVKGIKGIQIPNRIFVALEGIILPRSVSKTFNSRTMFLVYDLSRFWTFLQFCQQTLLLPGFLY